MGMFTKFLESLGLLRKKVNVLLIGLDNSGKSTIVSWFKLSKAPDPSLIPPTVGFTVEQFCSNTRNLAFTVFDMSGQGRYRNLWETYYPDCDALIFVVDSSDKLRISVARDEFEGVLNSPVIKRKPVPLLILANKTDLPDVMTPVELTNAMGLDNVKNRSWWFCSCCALTGEGLAEGLDWLSGQLTRA